MEPFWLVFIIGIILGYYFGRWRAENRRARYDQRRLGDSRRNYRDRQ